MTKHYFETIFKVNNFFAKLFDNYSSGPIEFILTETAEWTKETDVVPLSNTSSGASCISGSTSLGMKDKLHFLSSTEGTVTVSLFYVVPSNEESSF